MLWRFSRNFYILCFELKMARCIIGTWSLSYCFQFGFSYTMALFHHHFIFYFLFLKIELINITSIYVFLCFVIPIRKQFEKLNQNLKLKNIFLETFFFWKVSWEFKCVSKTYQRNWMLFINKIVTKWYLDMFHF